MRIREALNNNNPLAGKHRKFLDPLVLLLRRYSAANLEESGGDVLHVWMYNTNKNTNTNTPRGFSLSVYLSLSPLQITIPISLSTPLLLD